LNIDQLEEKSGEELYLKIWEIEQTHSSKRWTIATFFLGISFAILGFSFTTETAQVPLLPQYLAAMISYWFGWLLFVRLNHYSQFLRDYLSQLEAVGAVPFKLQAETRAFMSKKGIFSTTKLLLYFGVLYTIGIIGILIWL
jgi:hypothetical protein